MKIRMTLLLVAWFGLTGSVRAQQTCSPPQIPKPEPTQDFFDDRAEMDLGDVITEQLKRNYLVIDDEGLSGNLDRIGQKLIAQAPPTGLKIQFLLAELPTANAWTLPGGRIYVSRKLVAMAQNEDEIAGILGHELG